MINMKKGILGLVLSIFAIQLYAQAPLTEVDALRFSRSFGLQGTASSVGKAGAIGALGGDLSSMSSNPAGLGIFSRSELSYSPMWQWNNNDSKYEGRDGFGSDHSSRFGTFSAVFVYGVDEKKFSGFKSFQLGIGKNRLEQYNNTFSARGKASTSAVDEWLYLAGRYGFDNYKVDLVERAGLLFYDTVINGYRTPIVDTINYPGELTHKRNVVEKGGAWDYSISYAANYQDFLYLGLSVGLPEFEYKKTSVYSEDDHLGAMPDFDYFDYKETSEVEGTGFNLKMGAMVRATDWLRVGLAYHTPTYYTVDSWYYTDIESQVFNRKHFVYSDDYYNPELSYSLRTPGKFLGSLAFVYGNQHSKLAGTLSADYEYTNYASMRYSSINGVYWTEENQWIKDTYKASHTVRVGGQVNIEKIAFRLGYAFFSSPYKDKQFESDQYAITTGIGYRNRWYYIDLAYVYMHKEDKQLMYDAYDMSLVDMKYNKSNLMLTLGIRF